MAASLEEQFRFEQAEAREQGLEQGERIGLEKAALNMINHGMSIDDVVKITGLSRDDIKKIM